MITKEKDIQLEIDKRILKIIDGLIKDGIVPTLSFLLEEIGTYKQIATGIKDGTRHFTVKQIHQICKIYGINANYIFGFSKDKFIN